jgi:PTS system nitrogen regulatory IIA component
LTANIQSDNAGTIQQESKMKLSDIIVTDAIIPELKATTRDEAIDELVNAMADSGAIAKAKVKTVIETIKAREAQATTGIGKGISLPHAKLKGIKKPTGTIGRSAEGIDFSSLDGKPVYSVILLLSSPESPDEHLQAMEAIFKHVQRDIFRKFLRQSETQEAIIDLIHEADELG